VSSNGIEEPSHRLEFFISIVHVINGLNFYIKNGFITKRLYIAVKGDKFGECSLDSWTTCSNDTACTSGFREYKGPSSSLETIARL
jgi:hypothetical protein